MDNEEITSKQNNRQKKKSSASVHNASIEISKNLFPIGQCNCKEHGQLFMYMASEKDNILNIYCTDCEAIHKYDHLDEYDGLQLFFSIADITNTLVETYGEDIIDELLGH